MDPNKELRAILNGDESSDHKPYLPASVAERYLKIYVGFIDWMPELTKLSNKQKDSEKLRKIICATILLPWFDKSTRIDPEHPENLLHRMPYFDQVNEKDWFKEFQEVFRKDSNVDIDRRKIYVLGVITPFEYAPITRQAYNWLYMRAEETGAINDRTKQDVSERFKNLVQVYGGAVICNIFSRHQEVLKKVINWRTGYFFERTIYEVYTAEQIMKIKKAELESTNEKLVKPVRLI